ncbi:MAG: 4Fe-4S single cluster domain-containing protein [Thermoguttaceae bacterium]
MKTKVMAIPMVTLLKKDVSKTAKVWPENRNVLHLARRTNRCTVLGPGLRAVLWLQGCPFRCPGCVEPETQPFRGGQELDVASLADEIIRLPRIEGVTFSGGEPLAQAAALLNLVVSIEEKRDLSFMCYTGYTMEYLLQQGSPAQKALINRLDILIDGPYIAARHTDLRWRGSDNQKVHLLTRRYQHLEQQLQHRGHWLECACDSEGGLLVMGIPPKNFREMFECKMKAFGLSLTLSE